MNRVETAVALRAQVGAARADGRRVAFVPTMGALHDGHLSLVRRARHDDAFVVVSIFVNPMQFGPREDFASYPRDLDRDEHKLESLGAAAPDVVFAPAVEEIYPSWPLATVVSVRGLSEVLDGASRPGHFDGVTTVVAKLFNLVTPDVALFGRKDFQQLQVIRRMVADLDMAVAIEGCPTVREPDGLAMSSRNLYLDPEDRAAARVLPRALATAVRRARAARAGGEVPTTELLRTAAAVTISREPRVRIDYVEVVDSETLAPPDLDGGEARAVEPPATPRRLLVAVAAHVGRARLIDNVVVGDEEDEQRLLAAVS